MLHPFNSSFKEINAEFVADFKQNLADIHNDFKSLKQPDLPPKTKQQTKTKHRESARTKRED